MHTLVLMARSCVYDLSYDSVCNGAQFLRTRYIIMRVRGFDWTVFEDHVIVLICIPHYIFMMIELILIGPFCLDRHITIIVCKRWHCDVCRIRK